MRKFLWLFLFVTEFVSAENINIFEIYKQFTISSAASSKCVKPSKGELISFLANYQMVSVSALNELIKKRPDLSNQEANNILSIKSQELTNKVNSIIEKEGCENKKIQSYIKRFNFQSAWKP